MYLIDTLLDLNFDSYGKDPDIASPTLKKYHQILWSKNLPNGELFELKSNIPGEYLHFGSPPNGISLSSDSITTSYRDTKRMQPIIKQIPSNYVESFWRLNSTIGSYIIFPGKKIDGFLTINQERGTNHLVADRFDLTLECIRRHYLGVESPLSKVLGRYSNFFELFESFEGYVQFFLLDDLTDSSYSRVKFFTEITGSFEGSALPKSVDEYLGYRENSMVFTKARNLRVEKWALENNL
jgi:hypothetical protein